MEKSIKDSAKKGMILITSIAMLLALDYVLLYDEKTKQEDKELKDQGKGTRTRKTSYSCHKTL